MPQLFTAAVVEHPAKSAVQIIIGHARYYFIGQLPFAEDFDGLFEGGRSSRRFASPDAIEIGRAGKEDSTQNRPGADLECIEEAKSITKAPPSDPSPPAPASPETPPAPTRGRT